MITKMKSPYLQCIFFVLPQVILQAILALIDKDGKKYTEIFVRLQRRGNFPTHVQYTRTGSISLKEFTIRLSKRRFARIGSQAVNAQGGLQHVDDSTRAFRSRPVSTEVRSQELEVSSAINAQQGFQYVNESTRFDSNRVDSNRLDSTRVIKSGPVSPEIKYMI